MNTKTHVESARKAIKISIVAVIALLITVLVASSLMFSVHSGAESIPAKPGINLTAIMADATQNPGHSTAEGIKPINASVHNVFDSAAGDTATQIETLMTKLAGRTGAIETQLKALGARLEVLAASMESTRKHLPALESQIAGLVPQLEALKRRQQTLLALQQSLSRQLTSLTVTKQPNLHPTKHHLIKPPFTLAAIDLWDSHPYAVLERLGQVTRIPAGETWAGWRIGVIRYPDTVTVEHIHTGKVKEMKPHG